MRNVALKRNALSSCLILRFTLYNTFQDCITGEPTAVLYIPLYPYADFYINIYIIISGTLEGKATDPGRGSSQGGGIPTFIRDIISDFRLDRSRRGGSNVYTCLSCQLFLYTMSASPPQRLYSSAPATLKDFFSRTVTSTPSDGAFKIIARTGGER